MCVIWSSMLFSLFYLYIKISCLNDFDTNYLLAISQLVINLISSIEEKNEINFYLFLSFVLSRTISIDYWIKFSSSSLLCFYYQSTFDPWKSTCRSSDFTYLVDVFLFLSYFLSGHFEQPTKGALIKWIFLPLDTKCDKW